IVGESRRSSSKAECRSVGGRLKPDLRAWVCSARRRSAALRRGTRGRVWRRLAKLVQRVAVGVVEGLGPITDQQDGVLLVGPRAVGVDGHANPILGGLERVLQERIRADSIHLGTAACDELEALRVGARLAD